MKGLIIIIGILSPNVDFTSLGGVDFFALGAQKVILVEPPESETFGLPTKHDISEQIQKQPRKTHSYRSHPRLFRWRWR